MNKVVAVLGVIVLITLSALFFCVGFFTGTTMPSLISETNEVSEEDTSSKKISDKDIESVLKARSGNISDKVFKILSNGAESVSSSISKAIDSTKKYHSQMSHDALLKEIIASHRVNDACSVQKTENDIRELTMNDPNSLRGKRVVFIGYFKNDVALQIQKLLISKGYKAHVEISKAARGESFVFCGPFRKSENAEKLAAWLKSHEFSEARVINVTQESAEETLYDSLSEDSDFPKNEEKDIPEVSNDQLQAIQNAAAAQSQQNLNGIPLPQVTQILQQQQALQQGQFNPQPQSQQFPQQPQMIPQQQFRPQLNQMARQPQQFQQFPQQPRMIPQQQRNPMAQWQYTQNQANRR